MVYRKYLNSKLWKNTRKRTLIKQGNACRICGSNKKIHIHHRRYWDKDGKSIIGRERNASLLPICEECHSLWHKLHGCKYMPFSSLKIKIRKGVPKLVAFEHPYAKAKTLLSMINNHGAKPLGV